MNNIAVEKERLGLLCDKNKNQTNYKPFSSL
jgi:hypothetical protein